MTGGEPGLLSNGKEGRPVQSLHVLPVTGYGAGSCEGHGTTRQGTNWAAREIESPV